jgi:hypothetical protein
MRAGLLEVELSPSRLVFHPLSLANAVSGAAVSSVTADKNNAVNRFFICASCLFVSFLRLLQ